MNNPSPTTMKECKCACHQYDRISDLKDFNCQHCQPSEEKDHTENILVKTNSFEKFLQQKHAESYTGTGDDMPDAFEHWLSELEVEDLIQYGNEALQQYDN